MLIWKHLCILCVNPTHFILQMVSRGLVLSPGVTLFSSQVGENEKFTFIIENGYWCLILVSLSGMKFMESRSCWRLQVLVQWCISAQDGTCRYTHSRILNAYHFYTQSRNTRHLCLYISVPSFDFSVTVFAFLGLIALAFDMEPFYFIVVLRPLQLLR